MDSGSDLEDPKDQELIHCMVVPTYQVAYFHECLAIHMVIFNHVVNFDFELKDTYYPSWGREIRLDSSSHKN